MRGFPFFIAGVALLIWSFNSSLIAPPPAGKTKLIAHRGAHQVHDTAGVDAQTCTAERIEPPVHPYLENTIEGMRAAFDAGADIVELDVHLTPDGKFAVFHDWTLDCRTNGKGVTEETPMAVLKTLDIGYGYTADGGKTFPFRGKGIGLMPTLDEVFAALPSGKFLINFKSRREEEGAALAGMLNERPEWRETVFGVYGGGEPTDRAIADVAGLRGYTAASAKSCLLSYLGTGWIGHVPEACRNTLVPVPENYAWLLWGWPNRFMTRMHEAGSEVILLGPYGSEGWTSGIDTPNQLAGIPDRFAGHVWTNRILTMAPAVKERQP
ncbi:MAG: glycerophosphodiester phosphodiesterase family protein [Shinella sp.]|nr:glycerophosphodiester phosphodiesterase family protein [Shinella sp.]